MSDLNLECFKIGKDHTNNIICTQNSMDSDNSCQGFQNEIDSPVLPAEWNSRNGKQRSSFIRKTHKARTSMFKRTAKEKETLLPMTRSILVVDDNAFNLLVAQKLIEGYGIAVKTALNGKEAIDRVKEESQMPVGGFRLILMDLQMPVMDGFETTRYLIDMMKKGDMRETPIIALTANDGDDDIEMCLNVGMKEHLAKPLKPERLEKILEIF